MKTNRLYALVLTCLLSLTAMGTSATLSIEDFSINAGEEKEMVIDLINPEDEITLVEFDLHLPDGLSLLQKDGEYDIDIAGRTTWRKHSLDANAINGAVRFLLSSSSNTALSGTWGAIIKMTLVADDDFESGVITLDNILLVSPDEKETRPEDVTYELNMMPAYEDGDIFTTNTIEGVEMTFKVISASEKTCQVYGSSWGLWDDETAMPAIDSLTTGKVTIPAVAEGFKVVKIGRNSFVFCNKLQTVIIPDGVTEIEGTGFFSTGAFEGSGISSISIPKNVTSIGLGAFSYCPNLGAIAVVNDNPVYDSREGCNAIIATDADSLIVGCNNTTIPYTVKKVGPFSFWGTGIKELVIPRNVTAIGGYFYLGDEKSEISVPAVVKSNHLERIVVESGNSVYDSRDNCNAVVETATNTIIIGSNNTTIPSSVYSLGVYSLTNNNWKEFTVPVNVKRLSGAFGDFVVSSTIENVAFEEGYKEIPDSTLYGCYSVKKVTIPSTITSIGDFAFVGCDDLNTVVCHISDPSVLDYSSYKNSRQAPFSDYTFSDATIYVPNGTKTLYEQTYYWRLFNNIVEMDAPVIVDALQEGYYYIRNVATGQYATNGGNWGTHIAVDNRGLDVRLRKTADGNYWNILSGFTTYGAFGTEGYVDNSVGIDLTITQQTDGVYTIMADNGFLLTVNNRDNLADFEGESATDAKAQWVFVDRETLLAERESSLHNASKENPVDATFLIQNANINNSRDQRISAWTRICGNAYCNYGINMIDTEPIMEVFRDGNIMCSNDFSVSQTISLIPGLYRLEAQGFYRDGGYSEATTRRTTGEEDMDAYLFAGNNQVALKSIFDDATSSREQGFSIKTVHGYIPNTMTEAGYAFQTGAYNNELYFSVPEGSEKAKVKIGIRGEESFHYNNWTAFDNFQLTYYGMSEMPNPATTAKLSIEDFVIRGGEEKEMRINLSNPDDEITLVQFDLCLPNGLSLKNNGGEYDFDMCERTTWRKHSLDANAIDGAIRFLLSSSSNTVITGNEGSIIKMTLIAEDSFEKGDILLKNILLVKPNENELNPEIVIYTASGIQGITIDQNINTLVYSLTGQRFATLKKGINIVGGKKIIVK